MCLATAAAVSAPVVAATVTLIPGVYSLAAGQDGPVVDTLDLSVAGGVASFQLSGADSESFTLPAVSAPGGMDGSEPYYSPTSGLAGASYDTTAYPYVTFYETGLGGGFTIGSMPTDSGNNLVDLFESSPGTGQVFTIAGIPEPAAWALMVAGFGAVGLLRRRAARVGGVVAA